MGNLNSEIISTIGGNFIGNTMHSMRRKTLFENRNDALQKLLHNMPLSFLKSKIALLWGFLLQECFLRIVWHR